MFLRCFLRKSGSQVSFRLFPEETITGASSASLSVNYCSLEEIERRNDKKSGDILRQFTLILLSIGYRHDRLYSEQYGHMQRKQVTGRGRVTRQGPHAVDVEGKVDR